MTVVTPLITFNSAQYSSLCGALLEDCDLFSEQRAVGHPAEVRGGMRDKRRNDWMKEERKLLGFCRLR